MVAISVVTLASGMGFAVPPAPEEVEVMLPDCPDSGLDASSLSRALQLELTLDAKLAVNFDEQSTHSPPRSRIEFGLACGRGASSVEIRFQGSDGRSAHRNMSLVDLPLPLRARAVALAAAELTRSAAQLNPPNRSESTEVPAPGARSTEPVTAGNPDRQSAASSQVTLQVGAAPTSPTKQPRARSSGSPENAASVQYVEPLERHPSSRMLAAGFAARFFAPASLPAWGGRVEVHVGRLRVGADMVAAHVPNWRGDVVLGLAVIGASWELVSIDRRSYHASFGPRVGVGTAWSPSGTRSSNIMSDTAVAGAGTSSSVQAEQRGRTRLYLEGVLASDLFVHLGGQWLSGLTLELGVARGAGATTEAFSGSPLEAGDRTSVIATVSTLFGCAL